MNTEKINLERITQNVPRVRSGVYILYVIDKEGFEKIKSELSGDDYFLHDASKYPSSKWLEIPSSKWQDDNKYVKVWLNANSYDKPDCPQSNASKILDAISPHKDEKYKFLDAVNLGTRLKIDENGNYTEKWYGVQNKN